MQSLDIKFLKNDFNPFQDALETLLTKMQEKLMGNAEKKEELILSELTETCAQYIAYQRTHRFNLLGAATLTYEYIRILINVITQSAIDQEFSKAAQYSIEILHEFQLLNKESLLQHGWQPNSWKGVQIQNAKIPCADFSGLDLSEANLHGVDLRYANLNYTVLRGANLTAVKWANSRLLLPNGVKKWTYCPTRNEIASLALDKKVRLVNIDTGEIIRIFDSPADTFIASIHYSENGNLLALWDAKWNGKRDPKQKLYIFDLIENTNRIHIDMPRFKIGKMIISQSGRLAIFFTKPEKPGIFDPYDPDWDEWTKRDDEKRVLNSQEQSKSIFLLTMGLESELKQLQGHTEKVTCVDMARSEEIIISASDDKTIRLWNIARAECIKILSLEDPIENILFVNNGNDCVTLNSSKLSGWPVDTNEYLEIVDLSNVSNINIKDKLMGLSWKRKRFPQRSIVFLSPTIVIICGKDRHSIQFWNLNTCACMLVIVISYCIIGDFRLSEDKKRLFILNGRAEKPFNQEKFSLFVYNIDIENIPYFNHRQINSNQQEFNDIKCEKKNTDSPFKFVRTNYRHSLWVKDPRISNIPREENVKIYNPFFTEKKKVNKYLPLMIFPLSVKNTDITASEGLSLKITKTLHQRRACGRPKFMVFNTAQYHFFGPENPALPVVIFYYIVRDGFPQQWYLVFPLINRLWRDAIWGFFAANEAGKNDLKL